MSYVPVDHADLYVPMAVMGKFKATDATGKKLFALPAGARVTKVQARVTTAFAADSSVALGWTGDTDALIAEAELASDAAGIKENTLAKLSDSCLAALDADKEVIVTFTKGAAADGATVEFVVEYVMPRVSL